MRGVNFRPVGLDEDLVVYFEGQAEPCIYETVKEYGYAEQELIVKFRVYKGDEEELLRNIGRFPVLEVRNVEVKKKARHVPKATRRESPMECCYYSSAV